jgi:hypothetical protein
MHSRLGGTRSSSRQPGRGRRCHFFARCFRGDGIVTQRCKLFTPLGLTANLRMRFRGPRRHHSHRRSRPSVLGPTCAFMTGSVGQTFRSSLGTVSAFVRGRSASSTTTIAFLGRAVASSGRFLTSRNLSTFAERRLHVPTCVPR